MRREGKGNHWEDEVEEQGDKEDECQVYGGKYSEDKKEQQKALIGCDGSECQH